jgi:hypothetical protein
MERGTSYNPPVKRKVKTDVIPQLWGVGLWSGEERGYRSFRVLAISSRRFLKIGSRD